MNNVLFLCLDSARYDTFGAAKTPNMSRIGTTQKVYSPACWTFSSIMGYMMNVPPIGVREKLYPDRKGISWVPKEFRTNGYQTAWLSRNGVILNFDAVSGGWFSKWFNHFKGKEYLKDNHTITHATQLIISDLNEITGEGPLFISILLMDTHHPYFHDGRTWPFRSSEPEVNFTNQVKAIEYVDGVFPRLVEPLKNTGRPTEVIITSDHGELFGPEYFGHNPVDHPTLSHLTFDPKLFEIPFIRGEIG